MGTVPPNGYPPGEPIYQPICPGTPQVAQEYTTSDPPTVYMTVIMRVRYNTRSTGYGPYVVCNRDTEVVCPDIATRPYYSPQIRIIKPTDSDSIGGTRQISPMYGPMCRVPI